MSGLCRTAGLLLVVFTPFAFGQAGGQGDDTSNANLEDEVERLVHEIRESRESADQLPATDTAGSRRG